MRTIKELYTLKGKVYLWLGSSGTFHQFVVTATEEGFLLPRGEDDILVLNDDWSFCHPGFVGHMAFHNTSSVPGQKLFRVDYNKWISGAEDYLYHKSEK